MDRNLNNTLLTALLALTFGFLGAAAWSYAGLADNRTRAYLLDNPEIYEELQIALQEKRLQERLASLGQDLYQPFDGVVLGNPNGSKVLVEFTDYNCGFCRTSLPIVQQLVDEDPELKVVLREIPLRPGSEESARMALAAGLQGKYQAFHESMFAIGDTSPAGVELAARQIGLDMERARADAASQEVTLELARNYTFLQDLGLLATPIFVTDNTVIPGAYGYDALKAALDEADS
ncbi:MAG: DsbA family protein [Pseudomonadota bacterium]